MSEFLDAKAKRDAKGEPDEYALIYPWVAALNLPADVYRWRLELRPTHRAVNQCRCAVCERSENSLYLVLQRPWRSRAIEDVQVLAPASFYAQEHGRENFDRIARLMRENMARFEAENR